MRFRTTLVGLLAVAGLVAGCGSSSTSSTSTAKAASAASATTAAATSSTSTTTAAAKSFASSGNCQQLFNLGATYLKQVSTPGTSATANLGAALKADQAMADASPSAIHSDAELVVHTFASYLATLGKAGFKPGSTPTASQIAALEGAAVEFRKPGFQAASKHLSAWIHQNCGGVTP